MGLVLFSRAPCHAQSTSQGPCALRGVPEPAHVSFSQSDPVHRANTGSSSRRTPSPVLSHSQLQPEEVFTACESVSATVRAFMFLFLREALCPTYFSNLEDPWRAAPVAHPPSTQSLCAVWPTTRCRSGGTWAPGAFLSLCFNTWKLKVNTVVLQVLKTLR